MSVTLRQEIAAAAKTVVVKVGTRVLTDEDGALDRRRIATLAEELALLVESGRRVALVSSGAVGAGMGRLALANRPTDVAKLQAVAAVGQSHLIEAYDRALQRHSRHAAQLLLTTDDLDDRGRYLNVRNTILALFDYGAMPIINENDTVSVDELQISFGDNDRLAAMVTNLLRAPLLVLLSDVEGLYNGDPSDAGTKVIDTVAEIDASTMGLVCEKAGGAGKGGMASKLEAARIVTAGGENVIIASGRRAGVLADIVAGKPVGTLFTARGESVSPRKRWIGYAARLQGDLVLDDGACRAIQQNGRSLLAIGVVEARGEFKKGDVVSLRSSDGTEFARGLTNYSSDEIRRIAGKRSSQIDEVLGHRPYEEVIHRDNLALASGRG